MHIYAEQTACGYACMCMWLCISMLCSQLVIMNAWACDYAHLCCADCLWLCMHVHVIMHIYAMQRVCHAFSYANDSLVVYGLLSWLIQQTIPSWEKYLVFATYLVFYWITHIYAMKSFRGYACMCMWSCTSMLCSHLVIMNAWACDHAHFMLCRQFVTMHAIRPSV